MRSKDTIKVFAEAITRAGRLTYDADTRPEFGQIKDPVLKSSTSITVVYNMKMFNHSHIFASAEEVNE
jgi:hypothetical protein